MWCFRFLSGRSTINNDTYIISVQHRDTTSESTGGCIIGDMIWWVSTNTPTCCACRRMGESDERSTESWVIHTTRSKSRNPPKKIRDHTAGRGGALCCYYVQAVWPWIVTITIPVCGVHACLQYEIMFEPKRWYYYYCLYGEITIYIDRWWEDSGKFRAKMRETGWAVTGNS